MEKKPFYKTNSFKCVIVLLIILLLSGSLLTVAYGFMEVTDEERFNRAINKIYGYEMQTEAIEIADGDGKYATSEIILARLDTNGDVLVQSKGTGGYMGTVTCWVLVDVEGGAIKKVAKVVIGGSDGETLLNNIDYLDKFTKTDYVEGFEFTTSNGFVTSGASMSSHAIDNAVNGALCFVNSYLGVDDPYAGYLYTDYIDMAATVNKWQISGGEIKYEIVTKNNPPAKPFTFSLTVGADKTIKEFTVITYGSVAGKGQPVEFYNGEVDKQIANAMSKNLDYFKAIIDDPDKGQISTGATRSNTLCIYAAAFALANYDLILNGGNA